MREKPFRALFAIFCLWIIIANNIPFSRLRKQNELHVSNICDKEKHLIPSQDLQKYEHVSNKSCERYAFVRSPTAGFGHMFSAIILGYVYALEKRAKLVVDKGKFDRGGKHGRYPWAVHYLGLDSEIDIKSTQGTNLKVVYEKVWHNTFSSNHECDVLFVTCDSCCSSLNRSEPSQGDWCYYRKHWAFQVARNHFLDRFRGLGAECEFLANVRAKGYVDVVWHVRIGDLVLENSTSDYFIARLMNSIYNLFQRLKPVIFVVAEGNISHYSFYKTFASYNASFVNLTAHDALHMMIDANVLVTSGSAFSGVAAFLKSSSKIAFQVTPKEGTGVMDIFEHAIVDNTGRITHPPVNELMTRAEGIEKNIASV